MAEGLVEKIEHYRRVIAGLGAAFSEGRDYESIYEGDPSELPGVPASFIVPHARIPVVLPALRDGLAFQEDLLEGLLQMHERVPRASWRALREELDLDSDT